MIARFIGETPGITGLSPTSAKQGGASFKLTVSGSNFANGSTILWNGAALTTSVVSTTTLSATVPASDLAHAGTASITVSNPGNITSNAQTFTIVGAPPVEAPAITGLSPSSTSKGGASFKLTVSGNSFVNGSTVLWNGTALATVFVSPTTLTATVPASDLAQSGTASVSVGNPGNFKSNAETFTIGVVPGITQLSPASANQGGASFTLTVTGDNFVSGSAVLWNGAALATTFVSSGTLTATVPASDLAQPGAVASVTVINLGNASNAETTIVAPIAPPPPHVAQIAAGGQTRKGLTSITVTFDEAMDPGSAMSPSNYSVFGAVTKKKRTVYTKRVGTRKVSYNISTYTATITLSKPYKGVVRATASSGIMAADFATTQSSFVMTVR